MCLQGDVPLEETINQPSDTEKADDGTGQEKQEATSCQGKHESARRSTERTVEQGRRYRKLRTPRKALSADTWAKEKKERALAHTGYVVARNGCEWKNLQVSRSAYYLLWNGVFSR